MDTGSRYQWVQIIWENADHKRNLQQDGGAHCKIYTGINRIHHSSILQNYKFSHTDQLAKKTRYPFSIHKCSINSSQL